MPNISNEMDRGRVFAFFGLGAIVLTASPFAVGAGGHKAVEPSDALARLKQGNERFAGGAPQHPHDTVADRLAVAKGQRPFAVVLACADSRVSPELIFDQGLGDLFVVRTAGNTSDPGILGSIEYAVEHLGAKLVVVMGHSKCGACEAATKGAKVHGSIGHVIAPIKPAVKATRNWMGDRLNNVVTENVRMQVRKLPRESHILREKRLEGEVKISGAVYDLKSGKLRWL